MTTGLLIVLAVIMLGLLIFGWFPFHWFAPKHRRSNDR
jgi:branched-subunit amino acid transport protein AzlD